MVEFYERDAQSRRIDERPPFSFLRQLCKGERKREGGRRRRWLGRCLVILLSGLGSLSWVHELMVVWISSRRETHEHPMYLIGSCPWWPDTEILWSSTSQVIPHSHRMKMLCWEPVGQQGVSRRRQSDLQQWLTVDYVARPLHGG